MDAIYSCSEQKEAFTAALEHPSLGPDTILTHEHKMGADSKNPAYKVRLSFPTEHGLGLFVKLYDQGSGREAFEREKARTEEFSSRLLRYGINVPVFVGSINLGDKVVGVMRHMWGENLEERATTEHVYMDHMRTDDCFASKEVEARRAYLSESDRDSGCYFNKAFHELTRIVAIIHHESKTMETTSGQIAEVAEEPMGATVKRLKDYFEKSFYKRLDVFGIDPSKIKLSSGKTLKQATDEMMDFVCFELAEAMKTDPVYFKHAHLNNWLFDGLSDMPAVNKEQGRKAEYIPIDFEDGIACPQLDIIYMFKYGIITDRDPDKVRLVDDRIYVPHSYNLIRAMADEYMSRRTELGDSVQGRDEFHRGVDFGSLFMNLLFIGSQIRDYMQTTSKKRPRVEQLMYKHLVEINEATDRIAAAYSTPENTGLTSQWYEAKDLLESAIRGRFESRRKIVMGFD